MKHTNITNLAVINDNTGEIKCYLTPQEIKYLNDNRNNGTALNDNKRKDTTNLFKQFINEKFGTFYFLNYEQILKNEYTFRFIYLSTFVNYKGYLEFGNGKGQAKLVKSVDLKEMLKPLKITAANKTIEYFLKNKLIKIDKNEYIMINKKYICKGKLSRKNMNSYTKIINKNIQNLYKNSSAKEHKNIELFFKLLPYVNFKYNFICKNPNEEKFELIEPLKQIEIFKILGVSKATGLRLINFKILDGQESLFCKITNAFVKNMYMVNPRITFKTNNLEELEEQLIFFKVGKRS